MVNAATNDWPDPEDLPRFIDEVSERHGFEPAALKFIFASLKPNQAVLKAIAPPSDPGIKSWQRYQARFLGKPRIDNGVRFWNTHAETLLRAEQVYGVPPEIVVAIIGVETEYGKNKGNFSALEALATIAFAYPPRRDYFRSELEQLLLLARENRQAPEAILGSYAGALGIPQFMPGSQRRFAVDFDEDGRIDLMSSPQDAIGSIARFLKVHGWQQGHTIAERIGSSIPDAQRLVLTGIRPSLERSDLLKSNLGDANLPTESPAALIDLITPEADTEYWWGFENFYAITRYNRSSFYAMSVFQLSNAIKLRRTEDVPSRKTTWKPPKAGSRVKHHRVE